MAVIEFNHISKAYHLGASRTSLREAVMLAARRLITRSSASDNTQLFWALRDVSFQVDQGETLGIIGPNGAGKSTSLKLLSRVTYPTSGHIHTSGRMAALIELGAGFHPDLSGRENIYLNGSILGLTRREIDARFSEMVEFAGLEKFIDTPVKRYSSGMYVRLAFAVAAHVRADLLLVDEVLSVGDTSFQQKCMDKMNQLRDSGVTIIFISHNLWSVSSFCRRALLLRSGRIEAEGKPDDVIELYRRQERQDLAARAHESDLPEQAEGETLITRVELLDQARRPVQSLPQTGCLTVRTHYLTRQPIDAPVFLIRIRRSDGLICCELMGNQDGCVTHPSIQGEGTFEARVGPLQLVPDVYTVETQIVDGHKPIIHATSSRETFHIQGHISDLSHAGVFQPPVEWLPQELVS